MYPQMKPRHGLKPRLAVYIYIHLYKTASRRGRSIFFLLLKKGISIKFYFISSGSIRLLWSHEENCAAAMANEIAWVRPPTPLAPFYTYIWPPFASQKQHAIAFRMGLAWGWGVVLLQIADMTKIHSSKRIKKFQMKFNPSATSFQPIPNYYFACIGPFGMHYSRKTSNSLC